MEWKWAKSNEMDLSRFVNEKAIQLLDKLPIEDSLALVQDESGRRKLVKAIYETLIDRDIQYNVEKYQPETETQLIRTPSEILSQPGQGTCLDLALLFCSLCFGYNLLPLLIVIEGHAFAAVSLKHQRDEWEAYAPERSMFNTSEIFRGEENLTALKKLIEDEVYIAVECTGFAHSEMLGNAKTPEAKSRDNGVLSFGRAVKAGAEQLEYPDRQFKFAIDIATAKYMWKIPTEEIQGMQVKSSDISVDQSIEALDESTMVGADLNGKSLASNIAIKQEVKAANKSSIIGYRH
jgi:hypothetical protein